MEFPWQKISPVFFVLIIFIFIAYCFTVSQLKQKHGKIFIILTSIFFVGYIDLYSLFYLIFISHVAYFAIKFSKTWNLSLTKFGFGLIVLLMGFKFYQVIANHFSLLQGFVILGISYYTFRICATLFDASRGVLLEFTYVDYLFYCLFFPIFLGGPVQRYQTFVKIEEAWYENLRLGLTRVLSGVIKKIFIADILLGFVVAWLKSQVTHSATFSVGDNTWRAANLAIFLPQICVCLFGFISIIRAYFDLSALTDIAIGLARCLGYRVGENFNKPLLALNLIDFWRRWHITIASWARDYVFSPLMLKTRNVVLAVFITMICMGMWHHPSVLWLIWGVGHGVGLIVCGAWQKSKFRRWIQKIRQAAMTGNYSVMIQNPIVLIQEKLPLMLRGQVAKEQVVELSVLRLNFTMVIKPFFYILFDLPAWIINFSYMSLIFISVSCASTAEALLFYKTLFGMGG